MESYEYKPLPDKHSIRILSLSAGSGDEPLQGQLISTDANKLSNESYEPLSYVWGDPTRTYEFICDGQAIGLTTSLFHALKRLRLPDRERRIWADQICINQDDMVERGEQVRFMNEIYKRASHVVVWLGKDGKGEADAAFKFVESLAGIFSDEKRKSLFVADHTGTNLDLRSMEDWVPMQHLTALPWVSDRP